VQRLLDGDASIVEGDVESAIGVRCTVDEGLDLVLDQYVGLNIEGFAAGGLDLAFDLLPRFTRRPQKATLAPSAAKASAAARPMPEVAPVTATTLPSKRRRPGAGGSGADLGGRATATPAASPVNSPTTAPSTVEPRMRRRLGEGEAAEVMASSNLVVDKISYRLILTMTNPGLVS
jgi:hypothetical protein